jgi:hypothetical protein
VVVKQIKADDVPVPVNLVETEAHDILRTPSVLSGKEQDIELIDNRYFQVFKRQRAPIQIGVERVNVKFLVAKGCSGEPHDVPGV